MLSVSPQATFRQLSSADLQRNSEPQRSGQPRYEELSRMVGDLAKSSSRMDDSSSKRIDSLPLSPPGTIFGYKPVNHLETPVVSSSDESTDSSTHQRKSPVVTKPSARKTRSIEGRSPKSRQRNGTVSIDCNSGSTSNSDRERTPTRDMDDSRRRRAMQADLLESSNSRHARRTNSTASRIPIP